VALDNSRAKSISSFLQSSNAKGRLPGFLRPLAEKLWRKLSRPRRKKLDFSRSGAWLNYCCDRAMDAYTLDDALRWQTRIAEALSAIIEAVAGSN